ncbi:J domain-containing protein [Fluviicola taffensis]|uniref:Heat shock protein DnaJ domain protein n=1 Tax=Fluviicola taffensis (strain DSM 16823 / NCIMB 13979 / RW262) TaxID=755732 RepID=F2ICF1_FLUTR|nr:J domain-containing protein [Fluviicola taffensis]AEA45421.1 heat shock protein DnaJ domain protein [Fluviicola taffensis DSM 16823]
MQLLQTSFDAATKLPNWLVILLFGVPFVGGLTFYIFKTRHARSWRKGIFPQSLKPTEDNYLEAYLALGAKLFLINYQESKEKVQFINQYFNRYFTKANYNFGDSLLFSLKYPIRTKTITDWMKIHLQDEGSRSQIIYFLAGLALINGRMNSSELNFLKQINQELELSPDNLTKILAIYAAYANHQKENTVKKSVTKTTYAHEILGIPKEATLEQIKKAYRKLVKIHHPDHFATGTESQQKMAAEKFVEIQNAYESLIG